jgi:hypothetical protein
VNENAPKRARQRARQMQAELDGRDLVETPRKAKPAFIKPAQLKAGIPTYDDDPPFALQRCLCA